MIYSQSTPENSLKDFFQTIKERDTIGITKFCPTYGELIEILNAAATDNLNLDSLKLKSNTNDVNFLHQIRLNELNKINSQVDSLKIDLNNSSYLDCKYQLIKDPQYFFTGLNGVIFFSTKTNIYELKVEEAIYINDSWKITKLGDFSTLRDSSVLTKKHTNITPFNSLNFEAKLVDVKMRDLESEPPPPPPPPPSMHPAKKHKKKN